MKPRKYVDVLSQLKHHDTRDRREYRKQYYQKNRDRLIQNARNWRIKNLSRVKQNMQRYYQENKEVTLADRKEYYALHKDEISRRVANRYRHKRNEILLYSHAYSKKKYQEAKEAVLNHYGRLCQCCGESHLEFLTIDHINGGGRKHTKSIKMNLCRWLVKNNFPQGFRILCMNCNMSFGHHGYCPHNKVGVGAPVKLEECVI